MKYLSIFLLYLSQFSRKSLLYAKLLTKDIWETWAVVWDKIDCVNFYQIIES